MKSAPSQAETAGARLEGASGIYCPKCGRIGYGVLSCDCNVAGIAFRSTREPLDALAVERAYLEGSGMDWMEADARPDPRRRGVVMSVMSVMSVVAFSAALAFLPFFF